MKKILSDKRAIVIFLLPAALVYRVSIASQSKIFTFTGYRI